MKKIFYSACAVLGILATGCNSDNESENIQPQSKNVNIIATLPVASKTTLSDDGNYGFTVAWKAGDVLTVSDGTDDWNYKCTGDGADSFTPSSTGIADGTYTGLYAVYVRQNQRIYVAAKSHNLLKAQEQSANGDAQHIDELQCMYGLLTESSVTIPTENALIFNMKQLYTIINVRVVNNTGNTVNISNIKLSVPGENIAGIFNYDVTNGSTTLKSSGSESINLAIASGSLANGATFNAYLLVNPADMAGKAASFVVTTDGGNYSFSKTLPSTINRGSTIKTTTKLVTADASKTYDFSTYPVGAQYAVNEAHILDSDVTIYTTKCYFNGELRVYSSGTNDGFFWSNELPNYIKSLTFNIGNNADVLNVYGSTDGSTWTLVGTIATTSTYADKTIDFGSANYKYFKCDVAGTKQVRIKTMTITYK